MGRRLAVIAAGAAVGYVAGVLAPVAFVAACVWDGRSEWSTLTKPAAAGPHHESLTVRRVG